MERFAEWLSEEWFNLIVAVGGLSGYAAVAWTAREKRLAKAEAMEARLQIETKPTADGYLLMEFTFDPPDRSEPHSLILRAESQDGLILYNAGVAKVSDGQGGFVPAGPMKVERGRSLELPFHRGSSGPSGTSAFLAARNADGSCRNIESGKVTIRVVCTASRKRLISITRTMSASA